MILTEDETKVIRSALQNEFILNGRISEETKLSLKMKFKFETEAERGVRSERNYKELVEENIKDQLKRDIQNTLLHRIECTCHTCIRVKEKNYIKFSGNWELRI